MREGIGRETINWEEGQWNMTLLCDRTVIRSNDTGPLKEWRGVVMLIGPEHVQRISDTHQYPPTSHARVLGTDLAVNERENRAREATETHTMVANR